MRETLWRAWYWIGRLPAIVLDLGIAWPSIPDDVDPLG